MLGFAWGLNFLIVEDVCDTKRHDVYCIDVICLTNRCLQMVVSFGVLPIFLSLLVIFICVKDFSQFCGFIEGFQH